MSQVPRSIVPTTRCRLTIFKIMSLHKNALKENPIDGRSSPATDSSASETSLPRTPSASTAFFPLDLPQFSSLEDEIPDAWKSPPFDKVFSPLRHYNNFP